MGNEENGSALLFLKLVDELQDLLLGGHVERRGRLVGNQQLRLQDQRHGDHDALALAAGKLVRIGGEDALHLRQMHLAHHLQHGVLLLTGRKLRMLLQHFADLVPDRQNRVQRGHRLLKDHGDGPRAQCPHPGGVGLEQVLAFKQDLTAARLQRLARQKPHRGKRGHRLAGTGFTDEANRFPGADGNRNAVQHRRAFLVAGQCDDEIVDAQNLRRTGGIEWGRRGHFEASLFFMRGSSRSRAVSPRRLMERMQSDNAIPGQKMSSGLIWK